MALYIVISTGERNRKRVVLATEIRSFAKLKYNAEVAKAKNSVITLAKIIKMKTIEQAASRVNQ